MSEARYTARTLPQVIAESAAARGAKVAITDGDVTLTYAELDDFLEHGVSWTAREAG